MKILEVILECGGQTVRLITRLSSESPILISPGGPLNVVVPLLCQLCALSCNFAFTGRFENGEFAISVLL